MKKQLTESDLHATWSFLNQLADHLHPCGRINVQFSDNPEIAQRQRNFLQIKQKTETK